MKIMLLMLREKLIFLLLMQRGNHNLPLLTPLCGDFAQKKWSFYCRGVAEIDFVLPMLRMTHSFLCFSCSVRSIIFKST